jgi:ribosomal protein L19
MYGVVISRRGGGLNRECGFKKISGAKAFESICEIKSWNDYTNEI